MATGGPANNQQEARTSWVSAYPFEPLAGGKGILLNAGVASSRAALIEAPTNSAALTTALICNQSLTTWVSVLFGDSTVVADLGCMSIPPGTCSLITIATPGQGPPTFMAAIAPSGTVPVQVTLGYGGN